MKIIQVHNYYKQAGGEDVVVKAELELLRSQGEEVVTYYKTNNEILGPLSKLQTVAKTIWNQKTYKEFRKLLKTKQPDIVHCHNTFPLISPSIYWACSKEKVPVIQTLHNYRMLCLNALLFRNNEICEKCITKKFKFSGVLHKCYRSSFLGSFVVATMIYFHKSIGTWNKKINKYIVLTEFQKNKLIEEGLLKEKIVVKPNFTKEVELGNFAKNINEKRIIFVGRLSKEKGCEIAIKAWHILKTAKALEEIKFLVIGDGPERENLEELVKKLNLENSVDFLGRVSKQGVLKYMSQAECLIFSSISYETFGLTIVEAFQQQCPVIVANGPSVHSVIEDNVNGLVYDAHSPDDLADKLSDLITDETKRKNIILKALEDYREKYTEKANYQKLIQIYMDAMHKQ